jgi:chemotaxis protein CheC
MELTEIQLDALREMANIGSGNAATALAGMLGRPVDLSVPHASALPLPEAVDAVGASEVIVTAVAIPVMGDLEGIVLLTFPVPSAHALSGFLGVVDDPEMELSALSEIGNILGSSYVNALGTMTGIEMEPCPPQAATDMLGAIVASVLASAAQQSDTALLLDSNLTVEGAACEFGFLFVPYENGIVQLLTRLGLWEQAA